jgi:hypothetical protein
MKICPPESITSESKRFEQRVVIPFTVGVEHEILNALFQFRAGGCREFHFVLEDGEDGVDADVILPFFSSTRSSKKSVSLMPKGLCASAPIFVPSLTS